MNRKRTYTSPEVAELKMESGVVMNVAAPSGRTDTGDHFADGGDDEEGLEGDAKEEQFDIWNDEESTDLWAEE